MRDHRSNGYYDDEEEGYEEDEYEEEEEENARSPPKPTKEEQEFLSYRERLKEKYRQRQARNPKQPTHDKDRFGSFFGPALPVIAPRVIEESKSIKETHFRTSSAKAPSSSTHKSNMTSSSSKHKPSNGYGHRHKVSEVKKKAQTLKEARDFSFLFSDDADLPDQNSTKNIPKSSSYPKPDRSSTALVSRAPSKSQVSRPTAKAAPSNGPGPSGQRQMQLNHRAGPSKQPPPQSNKQRRPVSENGAHRVATSTKPPLPPSNSKGVLMNKAPVKGVNGNSNHNHNAVRKNPNLVGPSTSKASSMQRHSVSAAKMDPKPDKTRAVTRSVPSSSKPQPSKLMGSNNNNRRREHDRDAGKKRPARSAFDDEDDAAIDMIRKMFRYDPNKWAGRDEDDTSDMEVGFDVIQKEERWSSKVAKEEDEEQLKLIEEEERRERMRKKQKMRHA